ncbi:MAG: cholest-4-en-3-one 26-monooxygenase [Actinomycetota bacterium]|jgi:cholest-4-en-3-one 26-monooxygenase|nr:cholest-4-en-3-one 26-monooxygenase [Actinomycetota bacterium]
MELSDINLLDRDAFAKGVPHEWFTYLRANHPVYKHEEPDGPGFWVITKYDDVVTVGRDGATYSSDQKRGGVVVLEEQPDMNFEQGGNLMLTMDAPEHTRYRKLVNRGFTPRQMRMLEPHIRELTAKIVDEVIEQGGCDYVVDVAAEVPLQVIAEMLGVPQEDRHKLFEWSNRMIGSEDPEYIVSEEEVMNAQVEMFMYANELAAARRAEPRDDIISALLNAEVDGDQLSEMDFNLFFLLIAVAGNETTRNSISHGIKAFCDFPEQYQLLVEDPARAQSATDEIVRWASPVMYFRRNVTKDTVLRGQQLKEGDKVSMWYISANRDEEKFDRPFEFDILRTPNEHVGFGGGGPHHCLGMNLARMEIYVLLEEMAKRMPTIERTGDAQPLRSNFIAGIKHMPVKFPPGERVCPVAH